jgi:5-(carboxyamino)imidazole ribonucleotide mutase
MKDILFIIGSESDKEQIEPGLNLIREKNLHCDIKIFSAHRNLDELLTFLKKNEKLYRIVITAAGLSAALPGVVAARVELPVIGVPLISGPLTGIDALLSILQLPKGIPVATMGLGTQGVLNAVLLAERILKLAQ